jgi:VIT1/CCC1 family predicted Fe2+/Mn2+ transporter
MKLNGGFFFGITSGVITTLGLIMGLYTATMSFKVVLAGLITIAVVDALSDSLGIHLAKESENKKQNIIWQETLSTFFSKLIVAGSFVIPYLLFSLTVATYVSIAWGIFILIVGNIIIAKIRKENALKLIAEHIALAIVVLVITYFIGHAVSLL